MNSYQRVISRVTVVKTYSRGLVTPLITLKPCRSLAGALLITPLT